LVSLGVARWYRGEPHLLGLTRRNLVVSDRHSEDWFRHLLDSDHLPGAAVTGGEKPRFVVKAVVAASEHEEIEARAGDAINGGSRNDDHRGGCRDHEGRRPRDAGIDAGVHVIGSRYPCPDSDCSDRSYKPDLRRHGVLPRAWKVHGECQTQRQGRRRVGRFPSTGDVPRWHPKRTPVTLRAVLVGRWCKRPRLYRTIERQNAPHSITRPPLMSRVAPVM